MRSSLPTTYPYVVKKEYFIVQDARPLYHWPEKPIPITKHDNWEPQFKPREVERPKSATVAAVLVEVAQVEAPVEEEEEAEDYDEEDDGELEEGGGQEKAEEGDGGGVEQQGDFVVEDSNCVKDADGGGENLEIADEDGEGYDGAMEEVNYQTTLEEYNQ